MNECLFKTVASLAEAWIEIFKTVLICVMVKSSLPLRKRGLKFVLHWDKHRQVRSLPLRKRGLKFDNDKSGIKGTVASLAEAWFEIVCNCEIAYAIGSLPLRKRGLKFGRYDRRITRRCRFPCGSVD